MGTTPFGTGPVSEQPKSGGSSAAVLRILRPAPTLNIRCSQASRSHQPGRRVACACRVSTKSPVRENWSGAVWLEIHRRTCVQSCRQPWSRSPLQRSTGSNFHRRSSRWPHRCPFPESKEDASPPGVEQPRRTSSVPLTAPHPIRKEEWGQTALSPLGLYRSARTCRIRRPVPVCRRCSILPGGTAGRLETVSSGPSSADHSPKRGSCGLIGSVYSRARSRQGMITSRPGAHRAVRWIARCSNKVVLDFANIALQPKKQRTPKNWAPGCWA